MPENGEMIELVFAMENAWLVGVAPIGPLPAVEWVARYEWMDDDLTEMML